ncbi:MAG TPA: hypothetical protein VNL70_00295, partial [Tepidisphaeraceae bacterium]|nr:hypothetical protein [Tepidisphaeraceae bacterium]
MTWRGSIEALYHPCSGRRPGGYRSINWLIAGHDGVEEFEQQNANPRLGCAVLCSFPKERALHRGHVSVCVAVLAFVRSWYTPH